MTVLGITHGRFVRMSLSSRISLSFLTKMLPHLNLRENHIHCVTKDHQNNQLHVAGQRSKKLYDFVLQEE